MSYKYAVKKLGHDLKVDDFPVGTVLEWKDGRMYIVVEHNRYTQRMPNEITVSPYNDLAQKMSVGLNQEIDLDYLSTQLKNVAEKQARRMTMAYKYAAEDLGGSDTTLKMTLTLTDIPVMQLKGNRVVLEWDMEKIQDQLNEQILEQMSQKKLKFTEDDIGSWGQIGLAKSFIKR